MIDSVSKCFAIYARPSDRLRQSVLPRLRNVIGLRGRTYYREFWALRDVSFDVRRGETMGIIGRNGAGKSTLLQIICGTLTPTAGSVELSGRVAALLELGSGFNPEFTGLENVYLNASLLGLTRKATDAKLDSILSFADIGDFVHQPVKTYSSGMVVRLAFAVQAQLEPDLLIVDEALAVGDARFQAKCFARLKALRESGTSILFVSHSTEQIVSHCSRAVLLEGGRLQEIGEPRRIVNRYLDLLFGRAQVGQRSEQAAAGRASSSPASSLPERPLQGADSIFMDAALAAYQSRALYNPHEYRWGDGRASLLDFMVLIDAEPVVGSIRRGSRLCVLLKFCFNEAVIAPILGVTLKTREGLTVYGSNSEFLGARELSSLGAPGVVHFACFEFDAELAGGDYFISTGIASREGADIVPHDRRFDSIHFTVEPDPAFIGLVHLGGRLRLVGSTDAPAAVEHVDQ